MTEVEHQRTNSPLFFLHIPKTAGSTLRKVLEAEYGVGLMPIGNMFKGSGGVDDEALWQLKSKRIPRSATLLTGHLPFVAIQMLPEETRNLTILRDPVERTISHYFYLADERTKDARGERAKDTSSLELDDFESAVRTGSIFPDNIQTRMLADEPAIGEACTESMLKQAKRNLINKFEVVGLVERFDESLALLWQKFGWRSPLYRERSKTTANRPRAADLSRSEREAIESTTSFDRELYGHAAKLFSRQIAAQDERFQCELRAMQAAQRLIEQGEGADRALPQPHDVFDYRVRQLFAEFGLLEQRERVRALKERVIETEKQLNAARDRNRRLVGLNEKLRAEVELTKLQRFRQAAPDAPADGESPLV